MWTDKGHKLPKQGRNYTQIFTAFTLHLILLLMQLMEATVMFGTCGVNGGNEKFTVSVKHHWKLVYQVKYGYVLVYRLAISILGNKSRTSCFNPTRRIYNLQQH
jgi:hypothetical protein